MTLPAAVSDLCSRFLSLAPDGLVTGLYLTGGLGFGEWVAGQSDVDFVATVDHRPSEHEVDRLREAHQRLGRESPIDFDGMHVLVTDLARDPRDLPPVPVVLQRDFRVGHLDQVVAWHELAWHGVTVTGPDLSTLDVWTDPEVLTDYTAHNLDTYWCGLAAGLATMSPEESDAVLDHACRWCVLGVARLHHLLVTGRMTTKSGAGRWGLSFYDERWHRVLREALRLREGGAPEYDDQTSRLRDTADFTAYVVGCRARPQPASMLGMGETPEVRVASVSRDVAADADAIFELIAEPTEQLRWDGNDNLAEAPPGQRIRAIGDVFTMITTKGNVRENHVVELEEGRRVAWMPAEPGSEPLGHLWRWELEPLGAGRTRVTHTYDWTELTDEGRFERARATTSDRLSASVDRLAALVEGGGPGGSRGDD